jgi:hypothetical protein
MYENMYKNPEQRRNQPVDNSTVPPFRTVPHRSAEYLGKGDQTVPPFPPYKGERGTVEQRAQEQIK